MTRIGQVVMLHHAGDREEARHRFLQLWAEIGGGGAPRTATEGGGRHGSGRRARPERLRPPQLPYACLQMTASGLSARQPPYVRPRAHTSVFFGLFGTGSYPSGTSTRGCPWCP